MIIEDINSCKNTNTDNVGSYKTKKESKNSVYFTDSEYFTVLDIPLFIINIRKITTTNIPTS